MFLNLNQIIGIGTAVILFLYGIESFSKEFLTIAGERLRVFLGKWTRIPILGLFIGACVTAIIQSSTATSVLAVNLVNSAVINFRQSLGIILGTNIGTTVTAFLVAFKLIYFGPWFILLGFLLSIVRFRYSFIGKAVFYFGLVFFALASLSDITAPLKSSPEFIALFKDFDSPITALFWGCLITAIIQSSSVTTGLVVILVQSGGLQLVEAIPIILGANIGTTFTGLLASIKMDTFAKRTAVANTIFNFGGVVLFFPFIHYFAQLVESIGGTPAQLTAYAHLIFNVVSSFVFLIFVGRLEWIAEKLVQSDVTEIIFKTEFIKEKEPDKLEFKDSLRNLEKEIAHTLKVGKNMLSACVSYIDLHTSKGLQRVHKYHGYMIYLIDKCEEQIHRLSQEDVDHKKSTQLLYLMRMIDFLKQAATSQLQITEIQNLDHLPEEEELTNLKAEIFTLTSQINETYEKQAAYLQSQNEEVVSEIDKLHTQTGKLINDKYQALIYGEYDKIYKLKSFYFAYLTKMQSIRTKLHEIRKLAVMNRNATIPD